MRGEIGRDLLATWNRCIRTEWEKTQDKYCNWQNFRQQSWTEVTGCAANVGFRQAFYGDEQNRFFYGFQSYSNFWK